MTERLTAEVLAELRRELLDCEHARRALRLQLERLELLLAAAWDVMLDAATTRATTAEARLALLREECERNRDWWDATGSRVPPDIKEARAAVDAADALGEGRE